MKRVVVNRLRELRQEHGLTQEQLAADLEVTRHTILALEVGRYVPSIELALRLAAYFDRPLETIFWLVPEEERRLRGQAPAKAAPPNGNEVRQRPHGESQGPAEASPDADQSPSPSGEGVVHQERPSTDSGVASQPQTLVSPG